MCKSVLNALSNKVTLSLTLLCFSLFSHAVWASSTLRCGSKLVSLNDETFRVRNVCGRPVSIDALGYKVIRDDYGYRHEVRLEEWTYGPKSGMYYFLRFEGGKLVNIKSSR